jgi:hypothetical protein
MPDRPKPPATSEPWWTVHVMRGARAERRGIVRAPDEASAVERAMEEFQLEPWQRRRVLVRPGTD